MYRINAKKTGQTNKQMEGRMDKHQAVAFSLCFTLSRINCGQRKNGPSRVWGILFRITWTRDAAIASSACLLHTDASALPPVAPRPRTVSNQPNQSAFHAAGINKSLAFTIDTDCRTHVATPRVGLVTDQCRIYVKLTAAKEFRLHPLYIACMNAGYCCSRRDVAWCVCVCWSRL